MKINEYWWGIINKGYLVLLNKNKSIVKECIEKYYHKGKCVKVTFRGGGYFET